MLYNVPNICSNASFIEWSTFDVKYNTKKFVISRMTYLFHRGWDGILKILQERAYTSMAIPDRSLLKNVNTQSSTSRKFSKETLFKRHA